jgi:hypothetical protein
MASSNRLSLRAIPGLAAVALTLTATGSLAAVTPRAPIVQNAAHIGTAPTLRHGSGSQDLYLGNIGGGVLLYSTPKNEHEVGDITQQLPRVTSVWVDKFGVLYAFTDNPNAPYETIEEFQPGAVSPSFSLTLQRYGGIVAADAQQNVYAQGVNTQGQQVIDVYPPHSQQFANEYVVPTVGPMSVIEGIAFDSTGTLLAGIVADGPKGQIGEVFRLDAATGTFVNLNLTKAFGGMIATDGAGKLYVAGGQKISVYAPGATTPSRIVHTSAPIITLTVAANGTIYVATYGDRITVYAPGRGRSTNSFIPQAQVSGLALGPG